MPRTIVLAAAIIAFAIPSVALAATVKGTNGDDTLTGTPAADTIFGKGGNDKITALAGHDRVRGGRGDDQIDAGAGNDRIRGDKGADKITAGDGDDHVNTRDKFADTVDCGAGADKVIADYRDTLTGCETAKVKPKHPEHAKGPKTPKA